MLVASFMLQQANICVCERTGLQLGHFRMQINQINKNDGHEVHLLVALPILTIAWQISVPSELEISHEYFPMASRLSLLRTSRVLEKLVVLTLYL